MLVHGIFVILFLAQVQGQDPLLAPNFAGPARDFTAYGATNQITVTNTATFTFTSAVRTVDSFVTSLNTVLNTFSDLSTIYQKDTVTRTVTSTLTLKEVCIDTAFKIVTATTDITLTHSSVVTQGILITHHDTRTRTLMHWSQNLEKHTLTRTTTITDKYQVIQMQTTLATVTVPITVTVTISNTVYQPAPPGPAPTFSGLFSPNY